MRNESKKSAKMLISIEKPWFTQTTTSTENKTINGDERDLEECQALYEAEAESYAKNHSFSKSDEEWFNSVCQSGTLNDKVSAISLRIRSSIFHNVKLLQQLLAMAKKNNRKEALLALEALKDLLITCGLPDRKLSFFKHQAKVITPMSKVLAYFEHFLKKFYIEILQLFETLCADPLYFVKYKVINLVYELLVSKPEQEQNLLLLLVNKLGDPDNKLASRTSFLLSQLLVVHPNMKMILVKEVEQWIVVKRATDQQIKYYGVIFLNQIMLSAKEQDVSNYLLSIYFGLFEKTVSDKKEITEWESKFITALLTGVNRSYPYSDKSHANVEKHVSILYSLVHKGSLSTSLQSLNLLSQMSLNDRFYKSFYEFLFDSRLLQAESKLASFFNVLHKALVTDTNTDRVKSFLKRILQLSTFHDPPFIISCLLLISDLLKSKPALYLMVQKKNDDLLEDDEEEVYKDVDEKVSEEEPVKDNETIAETKKYDPSKRDPRFSNAHLTALTELQILKNHYHPTVRLFAKTLLETKNPLECNVDPLQTFTLANFLERFINKNAPSASHTYKGVSIMQPKKCTLKFVDTSITDNIETPDELLFYEYIKMADTIPKRKKKVKKSAVDDEDAQIDEAFMNDTNLLNFDDEDEESEVDLGSEEEENESLPEDFDNDMGDDLDEEIIANSDVDGSIDDDMDDISDIGSIEAVSEDEDIIDGDEEEEVEKEKTVNPKKQFQKKLDSLKKSKGDPYMSLEDFEAAFAELKKTKGKDDKQKKFKKKTKK